MFDSECACDDSNNNENNNNKKKKKRNNYRIQQKAKASQSKVENQETQPLIIEHRSSRTIASTLV